MHKKNKNKIVIFHTSLFGGGGERVLLDLARGLALSGVSVDLLLGTTKGPFSAELKDVNVVDFDAKRIIYTIPKIISYLRKNRPTSIMTTAEHASIAGILATKLSFSGTKIFIRIGNPYSIILRRYNNFFDKRIIVPLVKFLYPLADGFIANAHGIADDFSKTINVDRDRISVIHNPKFIEEIQEKAKDGISHKWLTQKDIPVVITNARISIQKDLETLLRSIAIMNKEKPVRLIIIGRGDEKKIHTIADSLDIGDKVDTIGFVENPYAYISRADVFVLPSLWEGLPNSLMEALVCGTPAVATDCIGGGSREILALDTELNKRIQKGIEYAEYGILVEPKEPEYIARAVEELLNDKELREQYIERGLQRAHDFSHEEIIVEYKNMLLCSKHVK